MSRPRENPQAPLARRATSPDALDDATLARIEARGRSTAKRHSGEIPRLRRAGLRSRTSGAALTARERAVTMFGGKLRLGHQALTTAC